MFQDRSSCLGAMSVIPLLGDEQDVVVVVVKTTTTIMTTTT